MGVGKSGDTMEATNGGISRKFIIEEWNLNLYTFASEDASRGAKVSNLGIKNEEWLGV